MLTFTVSVIEIDNQTCCLSPDVITKWNNKELTNERSTVENTQGKKQL